MLFRSRNLGGNVNISNFSLAMINPIFARGEKAEGRLNGVTELGDQRALDRFIDIGVVKDDKRRVTAEL